jgi:Xaa-Pro aminopeptidase
MRATLLWVSSIVLCAIAYPSGAGTAELRQRRSRAAQEFKDGIVLIHAESATPEAGDGFRQGPFFYYFTGLENTIGAFLGLDGETGESWLFLPPEQASRVGLMPEVLPGTQSEKQREIDHIVDWSALDEFLDRRARRGARLYFVADQNRVSEMPSASSPGAVPNEPAWLQLIHQRWPAFELVDVRDRAGALLEVQSESEQEALRAAGKATVAAFIAGMRAIRPNVSQRRVEVAVQSACWAQGAHGPSFWPWAMSGANGVFPKPFGSVSRYDHLDSVMKPGDLVRLDVGSEWNHYQGDLGRTVPVSGRFAPDQREVWNAFVTAYHESVKKLRAGITVDQLFEIWSAELTRQRATARSPLAQRAIEQWSKRINVPFWQAHTVHLLALLPSGLRTGMTIAFEPIASIEGQGYYLEDMFLIEPNGARLLTPGAPYSAEDIERAMR